MEKQFASLSLYQGGIGYRACGIQRYFWSRLVVSISLIGVMFFSVPYASVAASHLIQDVETIEIAQVDNSNFPEIKLYVRVTDSSGKRVDGLTEADFVVTEDGKPVNITDFSATMSSEPIQTLMVIDVSGSMDDSNKMEGAKQAAIAFVGMMREQDQVGVMSFSDDIDLVQDFSSDPELLKNVINGLYTQGGTRWMDAVIQASQQISTKAGRKSIILLTDGMDNESHSSINSVISTVQTSGTPVYVIALGSTPGDYDDVDLRQLASASGGQFLHTPDASELTLLYTSLAQATQEEYIIVYHTPRPSNDGTRRNIQVSIQTSAGGVSSGKSSYSETHLISIHSNLLVAILCMIPLFIGLIVPMGINLLLRKPTGRPSGAPAATEITDSCPHCNQPLRSGAKFCAICGKPTSIAAAGPVGTACPKCGQVLRPGARFCNKCGIRF